MEGKTFDKRADELCGKLDEIDKWVQILGAQRDALLLSNQALTDRLNKIEGLAGHALKANPKDLEETWLRVKQIANGVDG